MKTKITLHKLIVFVLALAYPFLLTDTALAQMDVATARAQIIHNAADPAAESVDIYVNGSLFVEDLSFRAATPFRDVPAETSLLIEIYPAGANPDVDDAAYTLDGAEFAVGQAYTIIANGLLADGFADNPNEIGTGFDLYVLPSVEFHDDADETTFFIWHGASDAPGVDVFARDVAQLADDLRYLENTDYITVPASEYTIDIAPAGTGNVIASFIAPLTDLGGQPITVLASGFLDPAANNDGEPFGLLVVLNNGFSLMLPQAALPEPEPERSVSFRTQALDLTVGDFEVVVENLFTQDGDLVVITTNPSDGNFLGAGIVGFTQVGELNDESVTVNVEGAEPVDHVAHVLSGASEATLNDGFVSEETLSLVLASSEPAAIYAVVAFTWNDETSVGPAGSVTIDEIEIIYNGSIGQTLFAIDLHESMNNQIGAFVGISQLDLEVNTRHTDVEIDIIEAISPQDENPARIDAQILETADFFAMTHLGPAGLDGDGNRIPARNPALLTNLGDGTNLRPLVGDFATVFIESPPIARAQIIHNSADPAAEVVDIYVNGALFVDSLAFRAATPFEDLPAGTLLLIEIYPHGANPETDSPAYTLEEAEFDEGETYTIIANGLIVDGFADNPNGIDIGFDLYLFLTSESHDDAEEASFFIFHGATDAPGVDVFARDVAQLSDDLRYLDNTDYIDVPAAEYTIDIAPAGTGNVIASFTAPLSEFGGQTLTVLASGFLDPSANNNGEAFGLLAVLADGTTLMLPAAELPASTTDSEPVAERPLSFRLEQNYPNPFNPSTSIEFTLPETANVSLEVFNIQGQRVAVLVDGNREAGVHTVSFDAANLASGVYLYRIQAGDFTRVNKMMLVK